jgi:hypothetical protein
MPIICWRDLKWILTFSEGKEITSHQGSSRERMSQLRVHDLVVKEIGARIWLIERRVDQAVLNCSITGQQGLCEQRFQTKNNDIGSLSTI